MVGFSDGYCDVSYADSLLVLVTPWISTTVTNKENALQWGRVYIENTYDVPVTITDSEINDALKNANAILGNEHVQEDLFFTARNAAPEKGLTEKTVQATPVKSTKKYDANISSEWIDPFPQVTAILASGGWKVVKGGITTVPMIRR